MRYAPLQKYKKSITFTTSVKENPVYVFYLMSSKISNNNCQSYDCHIFVTNIIVLVNCIYFSVKYIPRKLLFYLHDIAMTHIFLTKINPASTRVQLLLILAKVGKCRQLLRNQSFQNRKFKIRFVRKGILVKNTA